MDAKRVDAILSAHQKAREDEQRRLREQHAAMQLDNQFRQDWCSAFATRDDGCWPDGHVDKLLRLGQKVLNKFWDFYISEMLCSGKLEPALEMTLIGMRLACIGDAPGLGRILESARDWSVAMSDAQSHLYTDFSTRKGLPLTIPLNQHQMADLLGWAPKKFQSQQKRKKWRSHESMHDGHARKWWHTSDPQLQKDVLRAIRAKFPVEMWSANRPEN